MNNELQKLINRIIYHPAVSDDISFQKDNISVSVFSFEELFISEVCQSELLKKKLSLEKGG